MVKQELVVLIVAELLLLVLPPFQVLRNPAVLLGPVPLIAIGFFHASARNAKRGVPSTERVSRAIKWLGIVFAIIFGIAVIIVSGIAMAFKIEFFYALWQIAGLYYGVFGVPYLLGLRLLEWRAGTQQ